jgi:hypothetical protein
MARVLRLNRLLAADKSLWQHKMVDDDRQRGNQVDVFPIAPLFPARDGAKNIQLVASYGKQSAAVRL